MLTALNSTNWILVNKLLISYKIIWLLLALEHKLVLFFLQKKTSLTVYLKKDLIYASIETKSFEKQFCYEPNILNKFFITNFNFEIFR